MAVQEISADELADLDLDIDDDALLAGFAEAAQASDVSVAFEANDEVVGEVEDLGFAEDVPVQTEDADMAVEQVGGETSEAVETSEVLEVPSEEKNWYLAAEVADDLIGFEAGQDAEEEEEEEEEEVQEEVDPVVEADPVAEEEAAGEDDDDDVMFFEDTSAGNATAPSPDALDVQPSVEEPVEVLSVEIEDKEPPVTCSSCGLPGHDATKCPFGAPEDIMLGDLDESDSDDDLPKLYPLFARYVSQHTGALVPKNKKGLTGEKRYFGDDKNKRQCWACGAEDHESNDCKMKRCFFCGEPGHDSRGCSEKAKICSHCRCKGHSPVACPTLASQELVSFATTHCLRCGSLGHANCGPAPFAMQSPLMPEPTPMQNPRFLTPVGRPMMPPQSFQQVLPPQARFAQGLPPAGFPMGLPPPTPGTPASTPSSPMVTSGQIGAPDAFRLVRPRTSMTLPAPKFQGDSKAASLAGVIRDRRQFLEASAPGVAAKSASLGVPSKAMGSKAAAPTSFFNGDASKGSSKGSHGPSKGNPTAVKSPGKAGGQSVTLTSSKSLPGKAPISTVLGKAPISKVPGKAPISKMPGKVPGKAAITKSSPAGANIMKSSAKRPSNGGAPAPKKAKAW